MQNPANDVQRSAHPTAERRTLRTIAVYEAVKGFAAMASAIGILSLLHHDLHKLALELVGHFGLDPSQHYPSLLLQYADQLNATSASTVLIVASLYVMVRFAEAWGLWFGLAWGEWLGALSGAVYVPFELRHLLHRPSWVSALVLLLNVAMVLFLAWELYKRRNKNADA